MTYDHNESTVFISYARKDSRFANQLYNDLKNAGMSPWLDQESLLPGQKWESQINKAIKSSKYFMPLLSSHSVGKQGYVKKELKTALSILSEIPESQIFVIPVRLDNCEISNKELRLIHYVDLFPQWDKGLEKVLQATGINDVKIYLILLLKRGGSISTFNKRRPTGKLDLGQVDLSNTTLRNVDFRNVVLNHANLSNSDLSQANLDHADLNDANLSNSDLSQANLDHASLIRADLGNTKFMKSILSVGAYLNYAFVEGADFTEADVSGAHFYNARVRGANFSKARFIDSQQGPGQLKEALRSGQAINVPPDVKIDTPSS